MLTFMARVIVLLKEELIDAKYISWKTRDRLQTSLNNEKLAATANSVILFDLH